LADETADDEEPRMGRKPDLARREELLDQITQIVLSEGFSSLQMGDLAKRLHCSRTTLYQLAPSKDELIMKVYARLAEGAVNQCRAAAEECVAPTEKIRTFFAVASHVVESPTSEAYWRDVLHSEELTEIRAASYRQGMDYVKRYIEEGIALGIYRDVNVEFLAYLGWVGSVAVRDRGFMAETGLSTEEAMAQLGEFIIAALVRDAPSE
jgi:AcrR family transcriptional regulator